MDESRRADGFDAHLARALASAGDAGDCPDAEALAAWLDGSLDPSAREACQAHVAACVRCQSVLAAAVRTEDVTATAGVPERQAATVLRFPRRRLAWAAPIALAATVMLAVWVARSARENVGGTLPADTTVAETTPGGARDRELASDMPEKGAAPPAAAAPSSSDVAPELRAHSTAARVEPRAPAPPTEPATPGKGRAAAAPPALAKRDAAPSAPQVAAEPASGVLAEAKPVEARPAPAPLPAQQNAAAAPATPADRVAARETEAPAATRSEMVRAPVAGPVAAAPVTTTETRGVTTSKGLMRSLRVASPSGAVEWQVLPGGRLTRTVRDGSADVMFDTGDDLRALAAWSDTVAWAVGARGAVWRTVDGRAWTRTASPANATLVGIVVHAANRATVTTSDGQRFTTEDGGRTWQRAPGR